MLRKGAISMDFNKTLMFENINYLIKSKNMKIGEFEEAAGVSPGYISRSSKDSGSKPSIDFIMKAAEKLGVSVDTLLRADFASLSPNDLYLVNFLRKLIADTEKQRLDWGRDIANTLNHLETDINGVAPHALFSYEKFMEEGETDYPEEVERVVFTSFTFGVHTYVEGDCFFLPLKNNTFLYVMNISKSVHYTSDPTAYVKEIWIHTPCSSPRYLCRNRDTEPIASLVENLYNTINAFYKRPKIQGDIKAVIDAYMSDDLDNNTPIIMDDELPF